jgi:hypothetical protein
MRDKPDNLKFLLFDRTFRTLMLAGTLVVIMGSSRPDNNHGLYPNEYWVRKAEWEKCADIAMAGDSRVLCGLSPGEMQKHFPGKRIYNYGYGSAWFSKEYMDKVGGLLDPNGQDKTIILGISPHSLITHEADAGNFGEVRSMSYRDRFMQIHFAGLIRFFDPLTFSSAIDGTFPSLAESHTERSFCPDGWLAVHKVPDSIAKTLRNYKLYYEAGQADPENIDNLIEYVEGWVGQGISVYGFVPPTCREMYELETAMSGFDEEDFIRRFENAGGVWIYIEPVSYHSFDGSHLQDDSAIQLTNDLCEKIIKKWALKSEPEN